MDALVNRVIRASRRWLAGRPVGDGSPFMQAGRAFERARIAVKFYYLASGYVSFTLIANLNRLAREAQAWDFLWPVAWMAGLDPASAIVGLAVACFLASLLAFHFDGYRIARILFAALFLCVAAVPNSLGGINHGYHAWLWIGVCLVLFPDIRGGDVGRAPRMSYLTMIVAVQALLMFFYSLAGFWKLFAGLQALFGGWAGNFSPLGFSRTLANRVLETGTSPPLAEFMIANVWLSWPIFMVLIYVQLVSVLVAFRPRLHVFWGYLQIGFHLGTWLLMEIAGPLHVLFLLLLFVMSPFRPERWSWREAAGDVPLFGLLLRPVFRKALARQSGSA